MIYSTTHLPECVSARSFNATHLYCIARAIRVAELPNREYFRVRYGAKLMLENAHLDGFLRAALHAKRMAADTLSFDVLQVLPLVQLAPFLRKAGRTWFCLTFCRSLHQYNIHCERRLVCTYRMNATSNCSCAWIHFMPCPTIVPHPTLLSSRDMGSHC